MFSRKDDKDLESSGRGGTQDSDWPEAAWGAGRKENPLEGSGPGVPAELGDWVERGEGGSRRNYKCRAAGRGEAASLWRGGASRGVVPGA